MQRYIHPGGAKGWVRESKMLYPAIWACHFDMHCPREMSRLGGRQANQARGRLVWTRLWRIVSFILVATSRYLLVFNRRNHSGEALGSKVNDCFLHRPSGGVYAYISRYLAWQSLIGMSEQSYVATGVNPHSLWDHLRRRVRDSTLHHILPWALPTRLGA